MKIKPIENDTVTIELTMSRKEAAALAAMVDSMHWKDLQEDGYGKLTEWSSLWGELTRLTNMVYAGYSDFAKYHNKAK